MIVLEVLGAWFVLSIIVGLIVGSMLKALSERKKR